MTIIEIFLSLWSTFLLKRKYQFIFLIFFSLINGISEIFSLAALFPFLEAITNPLRIYNKPFVKDFADFLSINSPEEIIFPITFLFCLVALFAALVKIINIWLNQRFSALIVSEISRKSFLNTLNRPYIKQITVNSSEVISSLTTDMMNLSVFLNAILQLITAGIVSISILVTLLVVDLQIALVSGILFSSFYGLIIYTNKKRINNNGRKISELVSSQVKFIQEPLEGIRDVILDSNQRYYFNKYISVDKPYRILLSENNFLSNYPRFLMETIGIITIACIAFALVQKDSNISLAIPKLGAIALGFQRLLPSIQQLYLSWANINTYKSSIEKILYFLNTEIKNKFSIDKNEFNFQSNIEFKEVFFKYKERSLNIMENFNFKVFKGERIGIIGPTGSGKSTFIDLFMGLLKPSKGLILIDGKDLYEKNNNLLTNWRASIAHVPQRIYLSDSSIRSNIAFGIDEKDIDDDLIEEVAEKTKLSNFVENLPYKYETIVGERGSFLSGGQIQRIGLARALYKKSSILVFDEATSALDSKTESEVIESINNLDRELTIIIIAHKLNAIKYCDRVLEFKKRK